MSMPTTHTTMPRVSHKLVARVRRTEHRIRQRTNGGVLSDNRSRGFYGRLSLSSVNIMETTRSTQCTQSARGATKVLVGEPLVHALHAARWSIVQSSARDKHDNNNITTHSPRNNISSSGALALVLVAERIPCAATMTPSPRKTSTS